MYSQNNVFKNKYLLLFLKNFLSFEVKKTKHIQGPFSLSADCC